MKVLAWYSFVFLVYCFLYNAIMWNPSIMVGMIFFIPTIAFFGIYLWEDHKKGKSGHQIHESPRQD